jgi:hypothetical protein
MQGGLIMAHEERKGFLDRGTGRVREFLLCGMLLLAWTTDIPAMRVESASEGLRQHARVQLFREVGSEEAAQVRGGDVRMILDAVREKLTVKVIKNEYEGRIGRIPPLEVYEIDVHNRIVTTNDAPFMPTAASRRALGDISGYKASTSPFPEGLWQITSVKPRNDKYGPFMVMTEAVGTVRVYAPGGKEGEMLYVGDFNDTGYGIHSNTIPFEYSKTYGCIIAKQADLERLAKTLIKDRQENPKTVQTIRVRKPDVD